MKAKDSLLALTAAGVVACMGWIVREELYSRKDQQKAGCEKEQRLDNFEKRIYNLELLEGRRSRNETIYSPRDGIDTTVSNWVKDQVQKEIVAKRCQ